MSWHRNASDDSLATVARLPHTLGFDGAFLSRGSTRAKGYVAITTMPDPGVTSNPATLDARPRGDPVGRGICRWLATYHLWWG